MSRNIKEIGKELMGKSLNSFHRKTGLTQLEKNNEMQDGILDGILSQVDDAYIEKTEQSNVMHLDGSGDGVVVVDGIEGNTMVNIFDKSLLNTFSNMITDGARIDYTSVNHRYGEIQIDLENKDRFKSNTYYTVISVITKNTLQNDEIDTEQGRSQRAFQFLTYNYSGHIIESSTQGSYSLTYDYGEVGIKKCRILTKDFNNPSNPINNTLRMQSSYYSKTGGKLEGYILILEGDWLDKDITQYIEGLQSSFEEKVNDEGKYEIEILSNNKCLNKVTSYKSTVREYTTGYIGVVKIIERNIKVNPNETYTLSYTNIGDQLPSPPIVMYSGKPYPENAPDDHNSMYTFCSNNKGKKYAHITTNGGYGTTESSGHLLNKTFHFKDIKLEKGNNSGFVPHKQNKIKLLLDEPLRSAYNKQDRLFVNNGKLMVERWLQENIINGTEHWTKSDGMINSNTTDYANFCSSNAITNHYNEQKCLSDKFMWEHSFNLKEHNWINNSGYNVCILKSKANTINEFKTWLSNNNIKVVSVLREPTYEEVLNEYGEPIILEGYENGTIYIDSTIVPTTTVRYTPKMESFKTLKEVNNNNIMLTNDVNDNIIPYMMDVDLMIMEKEMALMSQCKIRKAGAKDMTSMQKRTQDMLTRLIKGKTLTEQECKTRVVTYLDAGKITDAQADELMLLISEVYA